MPIRFLHPVLRLLEGSIGDKKAVYRKPLVRLPKPQFIVLYNGTAAYPEQLTLRLSDAFEKVEGIEGIFLELTVKVYNINEGHNRRIARRCEELRGYAYFVARVRYHEDAERKRDSTLDKAAITLAAVRKAIQDCREKNLLVDYWDNLTTEEIAMLGFELDLDTIREIEKEESFEEGLETVARNMLRKGFPCEQIAELSGLDIKRVRELSSSIQ